MGQGWQIVNIDKRQTTGHLGKLEEFFFVPEPQVLARLVSRDNCPGASGEWAGDRVVCLGEYADELPDNMLTDAEKTELASAGGEFNSLVWKKYKKLSRSQFKDFKLPEGKEWVMRNLTRKGYVRASKVDKIAKDEDGTPVVTIEQLLHLYILWSCDPSISMAAKVQVCGRWTEAGDRIDIDTVEGVEGVEGWKDITNRAVKELKQIANDEL